MRLRVLVDDRSTWRDLLVDVRPDHTVAELTAALAAHLGLDGVTGLRRTDRSGVVAPTAAVADSGLRWGDRLILTDAATASDEPAVPLRRLVVESGPDAGRELLLPEGTHDVGRSPSAELAIDDLHLSRRHLRIAVASTGVTVTDLDSSNGTMLDGEPVSDVTGLRPDDVIAAGASLLRLRPPPPPPPTRTARNGRLAFHRPPRGARAVPVPTVRMPVPGTGGRVRSALATARAALARGAAAPEATPAPPYDQHPGPRTLIDRARYLRPPLWERRPDDDDFLDLRVGWVTTDDDPSLAQAPVVVELTRTGSLGITCPDEQLRGRVLQWQVAQLAGLHSPTELRLAVVTQASDPDAWEWATWLPHTAATGGPDVVSSGEARALLERLTTLIGERRGRSTHEVPSPRVVLAIDDHRPLDSTALGALLREGPEVGVHVVCASSAHPGQPEDVGAILEVDPATGRGMVTRVGHGDGPRVDGVDGVRTSTALELALALAGVRDVTSHGPTTALPGAVTLLELLDLPDPHGGAVRSRWDEAAPGLNATVGTTATDVVALDLSHDGPHVLVGGAADAAIDEVVRCLVGALAADHPPSRLHLQLLDVSARGAFLECSDLPHVVTHAAGLDACAATVDALGTELDRRRGVLDTAGAARLADLEGRADDEVPARLVVVVAGAEHLPAGLANDLVAAAGHAELLGLHLVVATSRPTTTATRLPIHSGLRLALHTASDHDRETLLGTRVGTATEPDRPGRGHLRIGDGPPQLVQIGVVTSNDPDDRPDTVAVHDVVAGRPAPGRSTSTIARERTMVATDLARLVAACRDAARATDGAASHRQAAAVEDDRVGAEVERTFLFSDVVRSTALVDAIGDEHWLRLLQWHDQALVELVERHGGEVVDHTGDGFFVAFHRPSPALTCAVAIQRMLHRHRVEAGFAPEVRIGVHHATVHHDGRYRGRGVHVAARIAALAGGGEVLASAATLALVPEVATGPTRTEELRGISTPVPVASVQVNA